jgi:hypothetical protein
MSYVGDILVNSIINEKFTTFNSASGATSFSGTPIFAVYKDNSTTESTAGITVTIDFDSIIGLHNALIDTSQSPSFYSSGSNFDLVVLAGTVSNISVKGEIPLSFSVEKRSAMISNAAERNAIADAFLNRDMSTGTDSGSTTVRTVRQALRFLRNKWTVVSSTLSVKKEDDSTESWSATLGTTTSGTPIISLDPAGP